jgi:hypothetical protein
MSASSGGQEGGLRSLCGYVYTTARCWVRFGIQSAGLQGNHSGRSMF